MSTLIEESFHAQHTSKQQQLQSQQEPTTLLPSSPPSSTNAPNTVTATNNEPNNGNSSEHYRLVEEELHSVRESEARYKQQSAEAQKREKMLIRRLAAKEQEMQEYVNQNAELKASQAPSMASLRSVLLDPAVNLLFQKLKAELQSTKARLEDTQNELSAWKFTPDSNTGKRLMAKCRLLYQENEELGKMTSNGRLAKLEGDLALQKSFSEEVKKSQSELDDFLQELDEDVEGMQSTILFLQQELKLAKDTITTLERENSMLKSGNVPSTGACVCGNRDADSNKPIDASNADASDSYDNFLNGSKTTGDDTGETGSIIANNESTQLQQQQHSHFTSHSISNSGNGGAGEEQQRTLRSTRSINSVVDELRTNLSKAANNLNNGEQNGNYGRKNVKRHYEKDEPSDEDDDDDEEEVEEDDDDVLSTSSDNDDSEIRDRSKRRRKRRKN